MAVQEAAPTLSTSSTHIFEEDMSTSPTRDASELSDEQLYITYEIERTIHEIKRERYKRVALQFPDIMLQHAPRVFEALRNGLVSDAQNTELDNPSADHDELIRNTQDLSVVERTPETILYILGDTSYGACCVDEVAAEHVNADAVVHYGRACLSPTARLPVIYVFTVQPPLNVPKLIEDFEGNYDDKDQNVVLMADVTYQRQLHDVVRVLQGRGYSNIYEAEIKSDPSSLLPNRTVPGEVASTPSKLKDWQLFHISDPPETLLLTLASRVASISIHSTHPATDLQTQKSFVASTGRTLNRRYALLTSVKTVSIFGILINTLSVKNYLHIVDHVKDRISASGKKSYTFVVGKVNAAKVANFSEIGAWVVVGCWESSLIDSKDFWKPVITPFELKVALKGDNERIWNGEWISDYQMLLDASDGMAIDGSGRATEGIPAEPNADEDIDKSLDSEPESEPPEFDLKTGRYVSDTQPMQSLFKSTINKKPTQGPQVSALSRHAKGDIAAVAGIPSPAAEYLRSKRTWKGLGSDFEIAYEESGTLIQEGRRGIARGYDLPESQARV